MSFSIKENNKIVFFNSSTYNYLFNKVNGEFIRWGVNADDDPKYSPFGPEILDFEISAGGDCKGKCPYCYKGNGKHGDPTVNMSYEDFKKIINKMPRTLTQVALGIMNESTNPDFWLMMSYARSRGIIPNYTTHGLEVTERTALLTAKVCGAVAVSYRSPEVTYTAVKKFVDAGMKQTNIHFLLCEETLDLIPQLFDDYEKDPRLKGMKAIVFLLFKNKTGVKGYTPVHKTSTYRNLLKESIRRNIPIGFDSCSAPMFLKACLSFKKKMRKKLIELCEPCESAIFSSYINCKGVFYPCSFAEGMGNWKTGINVLKAKDFVKDVWNHTRVEAFRNDLMNSACGEDKCAVSKYCRNCRFYPEITICKQIDESESKC